MQSKDLLLLASRQAYALLIPLLEDLSTAPLVTPTAGDGNHAHWILGHLCISEGQFRRMTQGIPHPLESVKPLFSPGSKPSATANDYPPYDELLNHFKSMVEETTVWIGSLTEEDLDQSVKVVKPGFELFFGTWRQALMMRAIHWANHRGQLADCRRAAGRSPLWI